jgi:LAO/AO transport system ATPase
MFDPAPILAGERRALARLITQVENLTPLADEALARLFLYTGRAHVIGVTGAPGTGKSSLVNELTKALRRIGETVAVVAVDPTSPFSGGAVLGDRIRMRDLAGDPGVFIRSMASRGALGGLARTTADVARVLDAAGFQRVIVETVGAGQTEVDIARMAHTTLVVEAPGLGDDVQAIKAGILEIADILVVNKADRDGAERTASALQAALDLSMPSASATGGHHGAGSLRRAVPGTDDGGWRVPVLKTIATEGNGIEAVLDAIQRHRQHLAQGAGVQRRAQGMEHEVTTRLRDLLLQQALQQIAPARFRALVEACIARELHPDDAARALLDDLSRGQEQAPGH